MRPRTRLSLRLGIVAVAILATACQRAGAPPAPTAARPAAAQPAAARPPQTDLRQFPGRRLYAAARPTSPRRSLLDAQPDRWPFTTLAGPSLDDRICFDLNCFWPEGYVDGPGQQARFKPIADVATDAAGNAYVADGYNNRIAKVTTEGVVSSLTGFAATTSYQGHLDGPAGDAQFNFPASVAVGPDGAVYVADFFNHCIRKISTNQQVTTVLGAPGSDLLMQPAHVAVDAQGNIWASNATKLIQASPSGEILRAIMFAEDGLSDGPPFAAKIGYIGAMAVSPAGDLWFVDPKGLRRLAGGEFLLTVMPAGEAGYQDGPVADARFSGIFDIAFDEVGNLFFADYFNRATRRLGIDGVVSTVADSGMEGNDAVPNPDIDHFERVHLAADRCGNLVITGKNRIRRAANPAATVPCPPPPSGPLIVEHAAFSPDRPGENPDDTKDRTAIQVNVPAGVEWKLFVDGKRTPLRSQSGSATFYWGGENPQDTTRILPDATYTLRLERDEQPDVTTEVTIDTKAPRIKDVRFEGEETKVIKAVDPKVLVDLVDAGTGFGSPDDVALAFSTRRDGVTPAINHDNKVMLPGLDGAFTFEYQVPFEANSILYLGTQTLDVTATDAAGNRGIRQVKFAVGAHDRHTEGPILGYRLAGTYTEPPPPVENRLLPSLAAELAALGGLVINLNPVPFTGYTLKPSPSLGHPLIWEVGGLQLVKVTGWGVLFGLFDMISGDARQFIHDAEELKVKTPAGVTFYNETSRTKIKRDDDDNNRAPVPIIDILSSLEAARGNRRPEAYELWTQVSSDALQLLLYKNWHGLLTALETRNGQVIKARALTPLGNGNFWPGSANALQQSWGQAAQLVMFGQPDYGAAERLSYQWSPMPTYPQHISGNIVSAHKPYNIEKADVPSSSYMIFGVHHVDKGAKPLTEQLVVGQVPRFTSAARARHYSDHGAEFPNFGYTDASLYEAGAQRIIETGTSSRNNQGFERYVTWGNTMESPKEPPGRVYLYNRGSNEFVSFEPHTNTICTYFRPRRQLQYWLEQQNK